MAQNINSTNKDYKFAHYPHETGKGGLTIGWTKVNDDIVYSISKCSEKDYYTKSIGRTVCIERIEQNVSDTFTFEFLKGVYADRLELEDDMFSFAKRNELIDSFSIDDLSYGFIRDLILSAIILEAV